MVRKEVITILAVVLFSGNGLYAVPDKIFTSSGHILPGEEWANVFIYNDGTIVNMLGGDVDGIATYDSSMVNVTGGFVSTLDALEFSIANISGGTVGGVMTWDYAITNLYDGGSVFSLSARGQSGVVNMAGGITEYLRAGESGIINLYGGVVTNCLDTWDSATVNIYGYGFNYDPSAGGWDGGQLTGFWLDDSSFAIDLYDPDTYEHINLVPEPCSLILLAFGSLAMIRKR